MTDMERLLNKMIAETNTHQLMIMALAAQLAGMAKDWRERLEVMRTNCERGVRDFTFVEGNESANGPIRAMMLTNVREIFQSLHKSLSAREREGG